MSVRFVAPLPEERKAKSSGSAIVTPEPSPAPPPQHPALSRPSISSGSGSRMLSRSSSPSPNASPRPSNLNFDKDGPLDDNLSLTDQELRKMYEDEEVEWFLRLFSKVCLYPHTNYHIKPQGHTNLITQHVTEVYLPPSAATTSESSLIPERNSPERKVTLLGSELSEILSDPTSMDGELSAQKVPEDDWVGLDKGRPATIEQHEQRYSNPAAIVASVKNMLYLGMLSR